MARKTLDFAARTREATERMDLRNWLTAHERARYYNEIDEWAGKAQAVLDSLRGPD